MDTEQSLAAAPPAEHWRAYRPLDLHPILTHAMVAFDEHGHHGTSVRDMAARVGVTVPALHYRFANKQALLTTLLESSVEDVLSRCRAAASEAGDDPSAHFCCMVESIVLSMAHRRRPAFPDTEIRSLEPENRARYVTLQDHLEHLLPDTVEAGRAGRVHHPDPGRHGAGRPGRAPGVVGWFREDGPLRAEEVAARHVLLCLGTAGHPDVVGGRLSPPLPQAAGFRHRPR